MSDFFDFFFEILLPMILIIAGVVGFLAFIIYWLPEDSVERHDTNIYCTTTKPFFSWNEQEHCFVKSK